MEDDVEEMKEILRGYRPEDIRFNEPHFSRQLLLREGDRAEVIRHLLEPDLLVGFVCEHGKFGDEKYALHFKLSNTRTMILPVLLGKTLYVLTYILRHRRYQRY